MSIDKAMGSALNIKREMEEQNTMASLLERKKIEIKDKQSGKPLLETPSENFKEIENNEIRGKFAKFEFLKLKEGDLAFAVTDIHGDREKLKLVLDYIEDKKKDIEGDIHLISMGDIASGPINEDVETWFDLLNGEKAGNYRLHLLMGNVERSGVPNTQIMKKIKETGESYRAIIEMTDLCSSLPNSLFLQDKKGEVMMLGHSILPLVNKKQFENDGLKIYNKGADEIDKLGRREYSGVWASFDGEQEEGEYGGKKMIKIGKESFNTILEELELKRILRGHDSDLIENKAKDTGVHREKFSRGEVDTFHTSKKATGDFAVFAEINESGEVEFKKV